MGGNDTYVTSVSQCLNGQNASLVSDNISTPDGLAVDWVHDLLFWTDTGLDTISVLSLRTRHRRTLIKDDLDEPRAIAVDPLAGFVAFLSHNFHLKSKFSLHEQEIDPCSCSVAVVKNVFQ